MTQAQTCVTFLFLIHINFSLNSDRKKIGPIFLGFHRRNILTAGVAKLQFDYVFNLYVPYIERKKILTYLRNVVCTIYTIDTCR